MSKMESSSPVAADTASVTKVAISSTILTMSDEHDPSLPTQRAPPQTVVPEGQASQQTGPTPVNPDLQYG